jgi:DNA-binding transcriptional LysR family regulator
MNVSIRELRAFLHVASLQSFTRSAERLHITQAGLSAMIRALEAQAGSRLFDRTTRTVSLTEAGKALLPVASRVVQEIDAIGTKLSELSAEGLSTLRVGATPIIASKLLPLALQQFEKTQPRAGLRIFEAQRDTVQLMLQEGVIDVGLGVFVTPVAGVERRLLQKFELLYVTANAAAHALPIKKRKTLAWSAIPPTIPLVGLRLDNPIQQIINNKLEKYGILPGVGLSFNDIGMETQIAMAASGMGASIMPSFVVPALRNYKVVAVPLRPRVEVEFYWMVRCGRANHPVVPAFVSILRATFSRDFRGSTPLERR